MTTAAPALRPAPRIDLGLLVLRVVVGIVFAAHGAQKLFVFGIAGVSGAFAQMGAPLPEITGPLIGVVELFGGLALIAGLLTRLAAIGLVLDMLGAIVLVHATAGFFAPKGVEFVLTLGAGAATLALTGAGRYSLDHLIASRRGAR